MGMSPHALGFVPGVARSSRSLRAEEVIRFTAGDALAIRDLLGLDRLPSTESLAEAGASPFSGPFENPQIFYNAVTGAAIPTRAISEKDKDAAAAFIQARRAEMPEEPARYQHRLGNLILPEGALPT
jgi:hypothetical protein